MSHVTKFNGRTLTRDEVLIAREGYVMGYRDGSERWNIEQTVRAEDAAAQKLPLPKVTRPRRAVHGGFRFEVRGGVVVQQDANGGDGDNWYAAFGDDDKACRVGDGFIPVTPALLRGIASLIENPTEEVEG